MRGLFCTDLHMYKDINGNYCNTTLTNSMLGRYYHVVNKLIVATRVEQLNGTYEEAHCEKVDLKNLEILEVPDLMSPINFFTKRVYAQKILNLALERSELVFIRGGETGNIVGNLCIKKRKPYLVEIGGSAWDAFWNHGFSGKCIAFYMESMEKRLAKNASFVIYVTEQWLQKKYPCKCENTNASNVYLPITAVDVFERRRKKILNNDRKGAFIIGTTAAVNVKYKGQKYIIMAIARLKKMGLNFRYQLVGSGRSHYLRNIARKYEVEDRVEFIGTLNHKEVLDWLDTIDIYAQPSKQEGLPRALIEAMSRGCPCIGSTTAGIPELLDECAIFENGNVTQIYEILKKFFDDYSNNQMLFLAKKNFKKAQEFDINILNDRRNKIYSKYAFFVDKKSS